MSYVEENLLPSETVLYAAHIHWIVYAPGALYIIAALAFLPFYPLLGAAIAFLAIVMLVKAYIYVMTTEFVTTDMRIIAKFGWISRFAIEVRHDKVEGLSLDQSVWGRMFNYGTLVLNGTGTGRTPIRNIDNPLEFRKMTLEAIEASQRMERNDE